MSQEDLVSCLCITYRRVPLLRRAVACFLSQTWPQRELVVLHEDGDAATREYLAANPHPMIRPMMVPSSPHIPLGTKRQMAMESSAARYIATWDDDDWSAPGRLAAQIEVIRASGMPACTLERWLVYDTVLDQAWLSQGRTWEASLVAEREAMPAYEPVAKSEDLISIMKMIAAKQVVSLLRPNLYIYTCHRGNVSGRVHFKRNVFAHSTRLPDAFARRVAGLLNAPDGSAQQPITDEEMQAAMRPQAAQLPAQRPAQPAQATFKP